MLGMKPANVNILVAHQLASAHAKEDMNKLLGDPESDGYALAIHNPDNRAALSNIGATSTSHTPLEINTAFLQADYRIGISAIRPDPFAGATGGGTSVFPGVSGLRTILRGMRLRALTINRPLDMECPASLDINEASCLAGLDFIVNAVPDWKGSTAGVVGGEPSAAWLKGAETSRALSSVTINRIADVVIVSAGGSSYDKTLYDAVNCLYAAADSARRDGVIVLVAECVDGLGPDGFAKGIIESKSEKDVIQTAMKHFEIGMEKSRLFRRVTDSRKLIICSRLQESLVEGELTCRAICDPREALEEAGHHLGSWSNTIVLLDGGDTIIKRV
jgi:nickel-dependent lactate racemase